MIQIRVGQKVKNLTPMPLSRKMKILWKTKDVSSLNLKWLRHELINCRINFWYLSLLHGLIWNFSFYEKFFPTFLFRISCSLIFYFFCSTLQLKVFVSNNWWSKSLLMNIWFLTLKKSLVKLFSCCG